MTSIFDQAGEVLRKMSNKRLRKMIEYWEREAEDAQIGDEKQVYMRMVGVYQTELNARTVSQESNKRLQELLSYWEREAERAKTENEMWVASRLMCAYKKEIERRAKANGSGESD